GQRSDHPERVTAGQAQADIDDTGAFGEALEQRRHALAGHAQFGIVEAAARQAGRRQQRPRVQPGLVRQVVEAGQDGAAYRVLRRHRPLLPCTARATFSTVCPISCNIWTSGIGPCRLSWVASAPFSKTRAYRRFAFPRGESMLPKTLKARMLLMA